MPPNFAIPNPQTPVGLPLSMVFKIMNLPPQPALRHQVLTARSELDLTAKIAPSNTYHANIVAVKQDLRQVGMIPRIVTENRPS